MSAPHDEQPDSPRGGEPRPPQALQELLDELSHDLAAQLADGLALPALIVLDQNGRPLQKDALFLEGERAADDEVVSAFLDHRLGPEAAFIGFVRHQEDPPRIMVWDRSRSWVGHRRPQLRGRKVLSWQDDWPQTP